MSYRKESNYKRLGNYIELVDERNVDLEITLLLGLSISKQFIPSVANTIGSNMKNYKIIRKGQFACSIMQVRRDGKMPVALLQDYDEAIISQAYPVFKIVDETLLLPEYLMMWFSRSEFDRQATFHAVGGVRGSLEWDDFLNFELPIPTIEKQNEIVKEYNAIVNRIKLNETLNQKLEEAAQALYKHWFVDFEFPNENGEPYKSSGGEMVYCEEVDGEVPEGWEVKTLSDIAEITMGQSPKGESYNEKGEGEIFYQGRTDFGFRIPTIRMYTNDPKRKSKKGDVLMSVRAPVGDLNISSENCCIGRGLSSIKNKYNLQSYTFYLMKRFKDYFEANNSTGTIFSSINKDELHELKVLFYKSVATKYNQKVKGFDDMIFCKCKENQELSILQDLLLARMTQL